MDFRILRIGRRWLMMVMLLSFRTIAVYSQDQPIHLSLQQALDSTLVNNRDLEIAKLEEKIASAKWKTTEAVFLPQVDLSITGLRSDNPLNVFGFKLQQQSVQQTDFDPSLLNNPAGRSDVLTRLQVKQPILNVDQSYFRQAAFLQTKVYTQKTKRTRESLALEVEQAYLRLGLAYDIVNVLKQSLSTAQAHYQFTRDRVASGLLQESDALNSKVWVTTIETRLAEANNSIRNTSDYLGLLMGRSLGTVYQVDSLATDDLDWTIDDVPAERSDLQAMRTAVAASDKMIAGMKKSYLPRLNAFASYQFNDASLFGFGAGSYLAGIQLSWDIFRGLSTRHQISAQQLERDRMADQLGKQQAESQLELNKTLRQLEDARFGLLQQRAAVESADESLRILQNRYEQGLVNSTEVLSAQAQLSQQQLGLTQARFSVKATIAYIRFQTQTTQR